MAKKIIRALVFMISPLLELYILQDIGEATESGASFGGRLFDLLYHISFDIRDAERSVEALNAQGLHGSSGCTD